MFTNPFKQTDVAKSTGSRRFGTDVPVAAQGPYTAVFRDGIKPRTINPYLYEAIRESIGQVNGAINMLLTLDGVLTVEGDNASLVSEIEDFMDTVTVNDHETSMQAFYRSQGNEMYEQGAGVGGVVLSKDQRKIQRLRVADSKGLLFIRNKDNGDQEIWYRPPSPQFNIRKDGSEQVERILRNDFSGNAASTLRDLGYRKLNLNLTSYAGYKNEADNPYGTSIMRSMEFDTKILLTIKNSLGQVWDRFGNPSFNVRYKTKRKLSPDQLDERRATLATNLANAMKIKQGGNSADFVNAVGIEDDITIEILGAGADVLDAEIPVKVLMEAIVANTGLPPWMIGQIWGTSERLAARQVDLALQDSKTRFTYRKPGLKQIIATYLRLKGRTWRKGDWDLVQELPSLQDILTLAQANFLNAQADMVSSGNTNNNQPAKVAAGGKIVLPTDDEYTHEKHSGHTHNKVEQYVEDAATLTRLERSTEKTLQSGWDGLYNDMLDVLQITKPKTTKADPVFIFDGPAMQQALLNLEDEFIASAGGDNSELVKNTYRAWVAGMVTAASEINAAEVDETVRALAKQAIATDGLAQVRDTTLRMFRDGLVKDLQNGIYDGLNPVDVARQLKARFAVHDADWARLARSEISNAHGVGKMAEYKDQGIDQYNWHRAGGACPICIGLAEGGPYTVGQGPQPMRDSHPNCRCTVTAVTS